MAAYYVHIIRTVQPEGPYDFGGYSLGGMLAYEVTRQLQELGQTINSSVMLDSPYSPEMKKIKNSQKSVILQTVNIALLSTIIQEPEKMTQLLIHRQDVNSNVEDEVFLKQLIKHAKARWLSRSESQLEFQIYQNAKVQKAYEVDNYSILPLSDPQAVTCYYFRNKSGICRDFDAKITTTVKTTQGKPTSISVVMFNMAYIMA